MLYLVVGGFYGDEGKGKIVGYLSVKDNFDIAVRAGGGPQAGHTVSDGMFVCQIPSGFINKNSRLLISRGTKIYPKKVLEEMEKYDADFSVKKRIGIDYGCTIIEDKHIEQEKEAMGRIGSVGSGAGYAMADRALRKAKLAKDIEELRPYMTDVAEEVNNNLKDKKVIIEGVQGYGLSLLDHRFYPYVTSQDTTASQFLADVGVGPKAVDEIIVVYKSYVSCVGKRPLKNEWTLDQMKEFGITEHGTISGRQRRLALFDPILAKESMLRNTGTQAALTNIDRMEYFFGDNSGVSDYYKLTKEASGFVIALNKYLENEYSSGVTLISTGPNLDDMVDLRSTVHYQKKKTVF